MTAMAALFETRAAPLMEPIAAGEAHAEADHPWVEAVVLRTFAAVTSVRVFACVPQIAKAARGRNGAAAISRPRWGRLLASHAATILHAAPVLGDAMMAVVFPGNALACAAIPAVAAVKRRAHRRGTTAR